MTSDTHFRYMSIRHGTVSVPCLLLVFAERLAAENAASLLRRYIVSHGSGRGLQLAFQSSQGGKVYALNLDIWAGSEHLKIEIHGIDRKHLQQLRAALERVAYYVILLGFESDEAVEILPARDCHLFRSTVEVDGVLVEGQSVDRVDWDVFKEALFVSRS